MKLIITILVLLTTYTAFAFQNEPNGFRGIKWNSKIGKHKDLVEVSKGDNGDIYKRQNDKMELDKAALESIFYFFHNNKFAFATATSLGDENNAIVIKYLKTKFGKPTESDDEQKKYVWKGKKTTVKLDCVPISRKCSVFYMSTKYAESLKK